ncbi:MAG TPA: flavin reductase family protein [Pseudonocardiaceae bacterium]
MNGDPRPPEQVADQKLLRRAFGAFATGVTVVTVGGGTPHAMTANSFTSVSLDPALVLICVGRDAIMHGSLFGSRTFGVSVLGADQEAVARHFADRWRPLGHAQFESVDWLPGPVTGAPMIAGAIATMECRLWRTYDGGDHTIFVGELLSVELREDSEALLFHQGRFRRVVPVTSEAAAS